MTKEYTVTLTDAEISTILYFLEKIPTEQSVSEIDSIFQKLETVSDNELLTEQQILKKILERCCIYVPMDSEAIRVNYVDDNILYGEGEESGEEYTIPDSEIDTANSLFYELKLIDPSSL